MRSISLVYGDIDRRLITSPVIIHKMIFIESTFRKAVLHRGLKNEVAQSTISDYILVREAPED